MAGLTSWSPGQVAVGVDVRTVPSIFAGAVLLQKGIQTGATGLTPPAVTAPSVPATTVAATNTTGYDVIAYIAGSAAVTVIKVNGVTTGLTLGSSGGSATVYLPAGSTIALTYASTAPTWVWLAV